MDESELLALIATDESQIVEFKESLSLKDDIGEAVSAFSNCNDGLILVGVSDKREIVGVQIGKRTLEDLANYLKTHTDNHVFPKISVEELEGKKIVVIGVSESKEKPVFFKGRAYGKVGKSVHKLSASEIRKLAKDSGEKVHWDAGACENAKLEDIDGEKVRWFLRKAKAERNLDIDPDVSTKEALQKLNLMKKEKLTNASLLLFAKEPQSFFLQARARCAKFKGVEAVKPFLDMRVLKGTVFDQIEVGERFVLDNIKKEAWVEPGKIERLEKWEYPPDAVREAITNAVCHRNYESPANVHVSIFDDRIEVWSPGTLPEPLKPEDLKILHKSMPVNPLIAEILFLVKYIERWGSGTVDILNWCVRHGLPEPLFREESGGFSVVLRKYKISEETLRGLNERQRKAVDYLRSHGKITNKEYVQLNPDVTSRTAFNDLRGMVEMGVIRSGGKKKYRYYGLA